MQLHDIQRRQFGDSHHKQGGDNGKIFSHIVGDRESSQCSTGHQQLLTDFHNLDQFGRIIIQIYHIAGFLCSLRTTVHCYSDIRLSQSGSIIRTVPHHCHQFAGLLFLLDIFHFIFRLRFGNKIIDTCLFCNIFGSQRVITGHHHCLHSHFAQAFETFLNTRFDDILQFDNTRHFPINTYHQRRTTIA